MVEEANGDALGQEAGGREGEIASFRVVRIDPGFSVRKRVGTGAEYPLLNRAVGDRHRESGLDDHDGLGSTVISMLPVDAEAKLRLKEVGSSVIEESVSSEEGASIGDASDEGASRNGHPYGKSISRQRRNQVSTQLSAN